MKIFRLPAILLVLLASAWAIHPLSVRTQSMVFRGRQAEFFRGRPAVAGEVLARPRPGASLSSLRAAIDAEDDRPIGQQGWRRLRSRSRRIDTLMAVLSARGDVLTVEPNYIVEATVVPNDPIFPWGMKSDGGGGIYASTAWDVTTGSAANVVGVVDTGVQYTHPDLAANIWSAPAAFTITYSGGQITCPMGSHGFNAINGTCNPADDQGHGTHVSGTIGAVGNNSIGVMGVNWTTRIMGLKFLDTTGHGSIADAIDAIDFAIQTKAYFASTKGANVRVLSNSWAGSDFSGALQTEIQRANQAEMLFVAAAGNGTSNNDVTAVYPASMNVANVVAVAATQSGDILAGFSNWGRTTVHLAAPGADVTSTYLNSSYAGLSGTSMATPHVSGAAALVLSGCNLTTAQLKAALLTNVDLVPALNNLVVTNGRLNVDRALRSCVTIPTVSLTSPSEGAIVPQASMTLTATATDPDGIARVEFWDSSTLIGTVTSQPFSGTWSNPSSGGHTITAKAFDTLGVAGLSTPVHITVGNGPVTSATFAGTDTTTKGSWRGVYGADGYVVVNDANSPPAYATVTPTGTSTWEWSGATTDVRALQRSVGSSRVAAAWYGTSFGVDVNVTDGGSHQLSLYVVDWDSGGRGQIFEVRDAVTNALLDTRTVTAFAGGQYWRWTVRGHVLIRALVTSGYNALVNGVFFDGGVAVNTPPTVTLTAPASGAQFTAPATITVQATASDSDGIQKVEFYQAVGQGTPTLIAPAVTQSPYQVTWNNVAAGSYTITAKAYDTKNASNTTSVPITVVPAAGGGQTTATFVGTDTTTQGTWRGVYGLDGYVTAMDATSPPAYATVTPTGAATWEWANVTTEVRALQRAIGSNRFAATFFGTTFGLDITITDGSAHQVSLYVLDWEGYGRAQTFEVRDAVTNALLDTRTVTAFAGGQYWRWTISGHVIIRAQLTAGANAVVSGVFFDGGGAVNTPPTVTLTAPASGAQFTAPATITVQATASDSDGIQKVEFYQAVGQGTPTLIAPAVTQSPYQVTWNNVAAGSYTITAKAYDTKNASNTTSVPITVVPAAGGGQTTATFVGTDTSTQGTWRGVYGLDGYVLVNDVNNPPTYATVTPTGASTWPWAEVTTDVRGLQRAVGSNRHAATWYGTTFGLDVNVTDGGTHQLSLYVVDWDSGGRAQTFEVRDAVTNALLDTRTVTAFAGGQYWRWTVSGHVVIRAQVLSGYNAVVSGVFFR